MNDEELKKYFDIDEKRVEARLNVDADIYIETISREPGDDRPAHVVQCECVDLSANGLQGLLEESLTQGAIHSLIIDIPSQNKNYRLTAEVRWVRPYKSDYLTGLLLYDSDGTEIVDWKFLISKYLN
jgi:hypothetical protein